LSALILLGSARSDGLTAEAAGRLADRIGTAAELIDLLSPRIEPFRYGETADDDFRGLVHRLTECDAIVFATPVYWYAMSGVMKNLFDRFTDLTGAGEAGRQGRALAGRRTWLLATGTDESAPDGFEVPFARTSAYLGMIWRGACYVQVHPAQGFDRAGRRILDRFAARIAADL
jgi:multimeric flavodoxin WrbA